MTESCLGPLAAKYHDVDGSRVQALLLHGWLDNAASFDALAPKLPFASWALDLPGHGASDWLPHGADYYIWSYLSLIKQALDALPSDGNKRVLIGHSMGSAIALQLAALWPEAVDALVLIDGIGPLAGRDEDWLANMSKALTWQPRASREFGSLEEAMQARQKTAPLLSAAALKALVERNLEACEQSSRLRWRTDPRLRAPSKMRLTEAMVATMLRSVVCPVLVIRAEQGIIPKTFFSQRMAHLQCGRLASLPGHHHLHMESEGSALVSDAVATFLQQEMSS
ncbi:alpha/beta fold hydrolase [Bacterioplanes sanyensis]|nr:alpha/beta hydrolase [Bacterioplanes sanyensis]